MAKRGRPPGKKYERTVTVQLTEKQWQRVDQMASVMQVSFAELIRMIIEVRLSPFFESYKREEADG